MAHFDKFVFCQNMYVAKILYGFKTIDVYVSVTRTEHECDCEDIMIYGLDVFEYPFSQARKVSYYTQRDPVSKLYSEWDLVLGKELTAHLLSIVDRVLEQMEIASYRQKKLKWRQERLSQGLSVR